MNELVWKVATLEEAAAFVGFGLTNSEDLPDLALRFLERGLDSPSLCDLASRTRKDDPRELRDLFHDALREFKIAVPRRLEAAEMLMRYFAKEVVEGRLPPESGASRILQIHFSSGVGEVEQGVFPYALGECYGALSQLDSFDAPREHWEQAIIDACQDILDSQMNA